MFVRASIRFRFLGLVDSFVDDWSTTYRGKAWVLFEAILCPVLPGSTTKAPEPLTPATVPVDPNFVIDVWHDLWNEHDAIQDEAAAAAATAAGSSSEEGKGGGGGGTAAVSVVSDERFAADWSLRREALEMDAQRMLRVMAHLAPAIAADDATALAAELLGLLQGFSATATTAAAMVKALVSLCAAKAPDEATALAEEVERWRLAKEEGNAQLQAISDDYKDRMAAIRNAAAS